MFRTEVVKSKNLRKSKAYKVFNAVVIFILLFFIIFSTALSGEGSTIANWIHEHYSEFIRPAIMVFAVIVVVFSMVVSAQARSPKRLGSIEIDETEIRYIEHDTVIETINMNNINSVVFEYYSKRMSGNPAGCMNYLTLKTNEGNKTYEIVVGNDMNKAQLGETLERINQNIPVAVKYANLFKKLLKDKDFKRLKTL